ncbi:unnamed protein product, partial [marine sediment metagenome]
MMEEILRGVSTVEEIAEMEKAIEEAKGKTTIEPALGFWAGKTPCWEIFRCLEEVREVCPAFKYRSLPCWKVEGLTLKAKYI